ncbi:MAG: right-handed parallel beta-helix repeat-containing protein, partial [Actinobacteria bacterium]|nr:right-handed parallel beta-helix repeat-containing protein [Actinomycetota bacterium]
AEAEEATRRQAEAEEATRRQAEAEEATRATVTSARKARRLAKAAARRRAGREREADLLDGQRERGAGPAPSPDEDGLESSSAEGEVVLADAPDLSPRGPAEGPVDRAPEETAVPGTPSEGVGYPESERPTTGRDNGDVGGHGGAVPDDVTGRQAEADASERANGDAEKGNRSPLTERNGPHQVAAARTVLEEQTPDPAGQDAADGVTTEVDRQGLVEAATSTGPGSASLDTGTSDVVTSDVGESDGGASGDGLAAEVSDAPAEPTRARTRKARRLAKAAARREAASEHDDLATKQGGRRKRKFRDAPSVDQDGPEPPTGGDVTVAGVAPALSEERPAEGPLDPTPEDTQVATTLAGNADALEADQPATSGVQGDVVGQGDTTSEAVPTAGRLEAEDDSGEEAPASTPVDTDARRVLPEPAVRPDEGDTPPPDPVPGTSKVSKDLADAADAEQTEGPSRRRTRSSRRTHRRGRRIVATGALVVGVVAAVTLGWALLQNPAEITLETTASGVESLLIADGSTDLAGLQGAAAHLGRPDAVARVGPSTYLLSVPVTVARSGSLGISDVRLRLLSGAGGFVGVEAHGGTIKIDGSTITSWDPTTASADADIADGRSYVLARDGARLDVTASVAEMLGYDAADRVGISWRSPASGGRIDDSRFIANFHGASLSRVTPMEITNSMFERSTVHGLDSHTSRDLVISSNVFRDNGGSGASLALGSTGATVTGNEAYGNGAHGIAVVSGSDRAVVEGNRAHDNGGAGISVGGSSGVTVHGNDVWSNTTGITVHDGARQALIAANRVSSNRVDGVLVSSEGSEATIRDNRVDHNRRAGVWISDGQVAVGPANTISKNEAAVRLADELPQVQIFDNLLEDNFKDGVNMGTVTGVGITGNRILDNDAAFSVRTAGDAAPYLGSNTIAGNRLGPERVRDPQPVP